MKLQLDELGTADQIGQLIEHRLDIGFLRGPVDEPHYGGNPDRGPAGRGDL